MNPEDIALTIGLFLTIAAAAIGLNVFVARQSKVQPSRRMRPHSLDQSGPESLPRLDLSALHELRPGQGCLPAAGLSELPPLDFSGLRGFSGSEERSHPAARTVNEPAEADPSPALQVTARASAKIFSLPTIDDLMPSLEGIIGDGRTATEPQVAAIRKIGIAGDPATLSLAQASAILSCKEYAEGAIYCLIRVTDGYPSELAIEAHLTSFVVKDDALRTRAIVWNKRRFARGGSGPPRPKRDEHLERVVAEAQHLLSIYSPVPQAPSRSAAERAQTLTVVAKPAGRIGHCYVCSKAVPRDQLTYERVPRGYRGRRHAGSVLMCPTCAAESRDGRAIGAMIFFVGVGIFMLICLALGIPLTGSHHHH